MTRSTLLLLALTAACAAPADAPTAPGDPTPDFAVAAGEDAWQVLPTTVAPAPSTGGITLQPPAALYAGETGTFTVTGAFPGETVYFTRSRNGEGAGRCYDYLGGGCFGILPPVLLEGETHADATGTATFDVFVPGIYGGRTYAVQALVVHAIDGLDTVFSDPVTVTTQTRDTDGDGVPDSRDTCPLDDPDDSDGDGVCDSDDPCPLDNPDDADGDGVCDADDPCPLDNPDDTDGDGVCDTDDPCPLDNPDDIDGDGVCATDDLCPLDNPDDSDNDGVCDTDDRCPGFDDANDANNDGVPDDCPFTSCKEILDAGASTGSGPYQIDPDGPGGATPITVFCDMDTDGGGWTRCGDIHEGPGGVSANLCITESSSYIDLSSLTNASFCARLFGDQTTESLLIENRTPGSDYGQDEYLRITWGSSPMTLYSYDSSVMQECRNLTRGVTHTGCRYASHTGNPWQQSAWSFTINNMMNGYGGAGQNRLLLGPTYHPGTTSCSWHNYGADQNSRNVGNDWRDGQATGFMYLR